MGLRQDIKNASTEAEIQSLLEKGSKFSNALEKTKRSWASTAKRRTHEIVTGINSKTEVKKGGAKKQTKKVSPAKTDKSAKPSKGKKKK